MKINSPENIENIAQNPEKPGIPVAPGAEPGLAGRCAWIISDGVAGHLAITRGVAEIVGLAAEVKTITPRAPWRHLAPNGPADPRILRPLFSETLPDIVLGAGRQTVPVIRALKRAGAFTAIFQAPRVIGECADVIWAPAHDRLRGPNVIATLTPPHRFTAAKLQELRDRVPTEIAALPTPRVTLLLGGPGGGYRYDASAIEAFAARLAGLADQAGSFLISPSRRTPPELSQAVDEVTRSRPRIFWNGEGENPYPQFLASADLFIVTADSVNMTGEACATGRPVYVFTPAGGRAKFKRFHQALENHGATRPLPEPPASLASWSYEALQSVEFVAVEIEARWRRSRAKRAAQ